MPRKIAVYVGENGETANLSEKGKIMIYQKREDKWLELKEKNFNLDQISALKYLRIKMEEIISFLDDCNTFVGYSVVGIPYYILEKANISVWECRGKPLEFLNYILEKEEEVNLKRLDQPENKKQFTPTEISRGNYKVSLKEIQENNTKVTSKQVLMPFLAKGEFSSIEIECNHVPLWLSGFLLSANLAMQELEASPGKIRVLITKKVV
ncbi:MAG: hypothetical protein PWQ67_898 [Clostridia bacterium]|jgi:Fe-only nitrogenase accessory protein AnfO|nr:hypothetical protein [Clostridia bacterium]MDN5322444.1 hypothetical protein [Clostridia bacterium]